MQKRLMSGLTKMIKETDKQVDEAQELANAQKDALKDAEKWGVAGFGGMVLLFVIILAGVYFANMQLHFWPELVPKTNTMTASTSVVARL